MRTAEMILGMIQERGRKGLPLNRVYRLLYKQDLFVMAYGRIACNHGALTPGVNKDTVEGMSLEKIDKIIDALRHDTYQLSPARRVYIEKKNSTKKRPLGLPTWSDKLVQEVIRLILEALYEPQFSPHSHGFRANRGCHTALFEIHRYWSGMAWFIEGDISACFDSFDHKILLDTLSEKIKDGRFIQFIGKLLKAGYLEDWKFNRTMSGTPQGGVVSPILCNIYLDKLDKYVETTLKPLYNRGGQRKANHAYNALRAKCKRRAKKGDWSEANKLRKLAQSMPSRDVTDPEYRRLTYVRYADDFLLGFFGPKGEAEDIKLQLAEFLQAQLKLELSKTKTLVTHARTEAARFLGYEIATLHNDAKRDRHGRRSINGAIALRVPKNLVLEKRKPFERNGKPIQRTERTRNTAFSIVSDYQAEYRGIVEYYRMAYNLGVFNSLKRVMEISLVKTLANKFKCKCSVIHKKYTVMEKDEKGKRLVIRVTLEREDRKPLVAQWGGISLAHSIKTTLNDYPQMVWNQRTELEERLLAQKCELCGSRKDIHVHHVRKLADLNRTGRKDIPLWKRTMIARRRKTLVVCQICHQNITAQSCGYQRK